MALTKDKKDEIIKDISKMLADSKMTVVAAYQGTPVKAMQTLRSQAKDNNTVIRVVKNRLIIQALKTSDTFKDVDTSSLTGMLLYAFNNDDEVAPAQTLANFAKTQQTIEFIGAFTEQGALMSADEVTALSALPGKNQMIAGLINTLNSPVQGVMSGITSNIHGLLDGISTKASN